MAKQYTTPTERDIDLFLEDSPYLSMLPGFDSGLQGLGIMRDLYKSNVEGNSLYDRDFELEDFTPFGYDAATLFAGPLVKGAVGAGKAALPMLNPFLRGGTKAYNTMTGANRGAVQFGKNTAKAGAVPKSAPKPATGGKNEIVPSRGRLPATKSLSNPAGASKAAAPKVDPKKGGGLIGAIKRNPIKTGLAGTAGVLGANAAFNTASDDEDPTKPVPGTRDLDEIDTTTETGGQAAPVQPLSERDKAAMLLDKAQQLKPQGPIRTAQDVAEDALARDVFEAGASKTRDILNEDELERKRAMRIRQQENSEQNMLRDAWRNSATGRKSGMKWDDLSDEDKAMYTDRYMQSKGYFPNSESRLASQREEDYKQGGADGTISNMDQLEEEIRRRNMQRKLEAAGGYGVGRIGGGMTLDDFETETGRKEALPPDPVVDTPDPVVDTPENVFDSEPNAEQGGFGTGYEKYLPFLALAMSRGKMKNFPMKKFPKGNKPKPGLPDRKLLENKSGQKLLENKRPGPMKQIPQKSAGKEQYKRAKTGQNPSDRAITRDATISNSPYKTLTQASGPNARNKGRFRSREEMEEFLRQLNRAVFK